MNKKVAIVIANWNGKIFLNDCLSSIFTQTYTNFDVFLIDNGSTDDSILFIEKNFPKVHILKQDHNTGFAYANNIGINEAFKDKSVGYIFTLNNDTVLDKDCLLNLVATIEEDSQIGSVAPKIKFLNEPDVIDSVGLVISSDGGGINRGYKEKDTSQYENSCEIFGTCAGASLYRRGALEDVSISGEFFDNSFFAYYEDLDLAWRLRLRGWKSWYAPRANVLHVHSGTSISYSPFKAYHINRNRLFLIVKNFPTLLMIKALLMTPYRYVKLLNSMMVKKTGPSFELKKKTNIFIPFLLVIKGWGIFFLKLPFLIVKRFKIQSKRKVNMNDIVIWFRTYKGSFHDMIYK